MLCKVYEPKKKNEKRNVVYKSKAAFVQKKIGWKDTGNLQ